MKDKRTDSCQFKKQHLQKCISVINSETIENDMAVKDNELNCFWEKRKKDACAWGFMITTSNALYQLINLVKPKTYEARYLASIYMIGSVLSYLSFGLYYYKKADCLYYTVIYDTFRNAFRMLDLENTRDSMPVDEW